MAIKPLDKQTADAVCTIITIGFMAEQNAADDLYKRTEFMYESQADLSVYTTVQNLIHHNTINLEIKFSQTELQHDLPFILSKGSAGKSPEGIVTSAYNKTKGFWSVIEEIANKEELRPYGAYIGGYADSTGFRLTGPSNLVSYAPKFRTTIDYEKMAKDYEIFLMEILKSDHCVLDAKRQAEGAPADIIYDPDAISKDNGIFPADRLVGCVHGMIHGMLKYPPVPAPTIDSIHIEFALGSNTTKVASCIPCSIFMSANGMPASATHLGRGDNWNFPEPAIRYQNMEEQRKRWSDTVNNLFQLGRIHLGDNMHTNPKLSILAEGEIEDIPQLFLESLTFQDSFTKRIISTLSV